MAERPEGVSQEVWRAKLAYEAVQAEHAERGDTSKTDTTASEVASAVAAGDDSAKVIRRIKKAA